MSDSESRRAKLRAEIMSASWPELLYQFARGGMLVVAPACDLLDVADELARDDRAAVERRLAQNELRRAQDDDARAFQAQPGLRFQFVIVQPWVVVQALG